LPLWYLQTLLGFRVAQSLVFRVVFTDIVYPFIPFILPLCCLSFDLRLLIIIPLKSSYFSYL
jgi:hypothetical protein